MPARTTPEISRDSLERAALEGDASIERLVRGPEGMSAEGRAQRAQDVERVAVGARLSEQERASVRRVTTRILEEQRREMPDADDQAGDEPAAPEEVSAEPSRLWRWSKYALGIAAGVLGFAWLGSQAAGGASAPVLTPQQPQPRPEEGTPDPEAAAYEAFAAAVHRGGDPFAWVGQDGAVPPRLAQLLPRAVTLRAVEVPPAFAGRPAALERTRWLAELDAVYLANDRFGGVVSRAVLLLRAEPRPGNAAVQARQILGSAAALPPFEGDAADAYVTGSTRLRHADVYAVPEIGRLRTEWIRLKPLLEELTPSDAAQDRPAEPVVPPGDQAWRAFESYVGGLPDPFTVMRLEDLHALEAQLQGAPVPPAYRGEWFARPGFQSYQERLVTVQSVLTLARNYDEFIEQAELLLANRNDPNFRQNADALLLTADGVLMTRLLDGDLPGQATAPTIRLARQIQQITALRARWRSLAAQLRGPSMSQPPQIFA